MPFFLVLILVFPLFAALTTGLSAQKIGSLRAIQVSGILNAAQTLLISYLLFSLLNKNANSYSITLGN